MSGLVVLGSLVELPSTILPYSYPSLDEKSRNETKFVTPLYYSHSSESKLGIIDLKYSKRT